MGSFGASNVTAPIPRETPCSISGPVELAAWLRDE